MIRSARIGAPLRLALGFLLGAVALLSARTARADKRAEAAARASMRAAAADYAANDYTQGLLRLRKAIKACTQCSGEVRAELVRDTGALQLASGETEKADASFMEALLSQPALEWSSAYDKPDLRAEWEAVKDEASVIGHAQPSGDFTTTPPSEQVVRTAIPVYVEYGGKIAKVVVKYKSTPKAEFKKINLSRLGSGWGGEIPCADVVRGVMRYYVQGVDEDGSPVALTGDPRRPLFVPVRWSITSPAAHLPGKEPPSQCGASGACPAGAACGESQGEVAPPTLDNGEVCEADAQCTSQRCANGRCAPEHSPHGAQGGYVHFWVGAAISIDVTIMPGANDVCLLNPAGALAGYPKNSSDEYCTTPQGADFPSRAGPQENATLVKGQAGQAPSGLESGDIRVMLAFDYAVSTHLLLGARVGFIPNGYPGQAAVQDGHAFPIPIHLEARGTYLFGDRPLAQSGFAPMVFLAGGVGQFDVSTNVLVQVNNVAGERPMVAWKTAGPAFAALGGGLRYAFSPRVAFTMALKAGLAFGGGFLPTVSPELGLQYGF